MSIKKVRTTVDAEKESTIKYNVIWRLTQTWPSVKICYTNESCLEDDFETGQKNMFLFGHDFEVFSELLTSTC
jgi:hypothetical protein